MTDTPMTPSPAERADTLAVIASTETTTLSPMERETLHRRVTSLYALADEVGVLRARLAELTAAPVDEAVELAEGAAELEAMRREHPAPCRVPDSPDCTCPSPERLLARDELKRMLRGHLFGGGTP